MAAAAFLKLLPFVGEVIDRVVPDKNEQARMKMEAFTALQQQDMQTWIAKADIVKAEAASSNWLTSSWRPITMLTFVGLIVARMLGYTAPGVNESEYLMLWELIKLGLGGYVIGRSVEKVTPGLVGALKDLRK